MLSAKEKIAYGLGDTASNLIFQTLMIYVTYYYTDMVGLDPGFVAAMFLGVRVLDAVTDPVMGALADKTRSRFGAYRPYLLYLCVPFGIVSVLAFTTPDFDDTGKQLWALVTYTALMLAYTAINIPYSALGSVLTENAEERVSVQSYRFVLGMLGGLIVTSFTLPLVSWFGQGDDALGYQRTMMLLSALGVVLFLICFFGTKERVPATSDPSLNYSSQVSLMWQNDQWRVLCVIAVLLLTGMVVRNTLAIYYVKYFLQKEDWVTTFITVGMIGNVLGCAVAQALAQKVSKEKAYRALQLISASLCVANFFVLSEQYILALTLHFLWGFMLQMATPLLWAKIADTVDYGEWKTGQRMTGVTYASVVFFIKLGIAVGGAAASWLLAWYGYQAGEVQTAEVQQGLLVSFCLVPAVASVLVFIVARFYRLDNQKVLDIQQALRA